MTLLLPVFDQKISNWLIKVTFLGELETVIRSGIKPRFGIMGFPTSDAFGACGLFFNICKE